VSHQTEWPGWLHWPIASHRLMTGHIDEETAIMQAECKPQLAALASQTAEWLRLPQLKAEG